MLPILVVADAEPRRRLADILRQAGYFVAEADSGESAINLAYSVSPKLILMAIVMQDSNGLEAAAKLRRISDFQSLPIILLGSVPPIGMNDEPLASLVSGFLNIDASAKELLATVRSHLPVNDQ
jgi:CheY-like chemotaxis protein